MNVLNRKWTKSLLVLATLTLTASLFGCGTSTDKATNGSGQSKALTQVKIGSSSKGAVTAIEIEVAEAMGYFKEEGIDPSVTYFNSGADSASALLSNQLDFSVNAVDHVIKAKEKGKTLKMIASFTDKPANTLVVDKSLRSSIKSVGDLKGKKIGVTGIGSGTHILSGYVLHKAGLSLSDVQIVPINGGTSNFVAAFKNHYIDAAMIFDPTVTELESKNLVYPLLDMCDDAGTKQVFDGGYQFTGLLTTQNVIDQKPDVVQHVVNAMIKANKFITTHTAEEIVAKLPDDVVGTDRAGYVKSFAHTQKSISTDTIVRKQAVANNLAAVHVFDPNNKVAQSVDPAEFFDMEFVEKSPVK